MSFEERIRDSVRGVVALLVARDYPTLEKRTAGVHLSADDLRKAVEEYGRTLRMPPDEAFSALDVGEVVGAVPRAWWVVADLWTEEEGKSDLSLEMTLLEAGDRMRVEIDNLHVM